MQRLEEATNARLRDLGADLAKAEGWVKNQQDAIQALDRQLHAFEQDDLPALARLVDALPQLAEELEARESRERALLGESRDLDNRYAELRNRRIECQ